MSGTSGADTVVSGHELQQLATRLLAAAGPSRAIAEEWARALVWANLRGIDSHGVLRIPRYVEQLTKGTINATPSLRVLSRTGAVTVMEMDRAPGPIAVTAAMRAAIDSAKAHGVGWCAGRNTTHAGAVGQFALTAAQQGLAGIVMTASGPLMAYHGSRVAGASTNPIAIAFPTQGRAPLLLDMSTSTVALGKLMAAKDAGTPIPPGWAVDADGRPATDPQKAAMLTPMSGPKGAGLSLMIECLASLLVSNPILSTALAAGGALDSPFFNATAIAIDPAAFGDPQAIRGEADRLGAAILALPKADGVETLYLPGGRGDAIQTRREASGIPIPAGTWRRLEATAKALGVAIEG